MIGGYFHEGSGLGDQLFRYITVRTLADKKGFKFGMFLPENFKGKDFLHPLIEEVAPADYKEWDEKVTRVNGVDVRSYDPEINFVGDNTILDGSFEDDKYWRHNLANISQWLAVEPEHVPDEIALIGFRGGEYASQPDLFLPESYYREAVAELVWKSPQVSSFEVHSDDPELAKKMLTFKHTTFIPNSPISHSRHTNMSFNWRSMRYAKHAIIPNSAFFILPRILKHFEDPTAITIAPRYWARRNTKVWARPACYYPEFTYV